MLRPERSLPGLVQDIKSGHLSSVELVDECLDRISDTEAELHAYISVNSAAAKRSADVCDAGMAHEPASLAGVPFSVKDIIYTEELPTTAGSRAHPPDKNRWDATVVRRLKDAGGILIGKTTLHEWACGITGENDEFGTAQNPWKRGHLAGGSSSGSAVSVATGTARFSVGTDTGGSIRVPAALSGIVGLKPTFGRISRHGTIPFSWSVDHVGLLGCTVDDVARVLSVVAGLDPQDSSCSSQAVPNYSESLNRSVRGLRIGHDPTLTDTCIDRQIAETTRSALAIWSELGASLVEVSLPDMNLARTAALTIQLPEALSYHRPTLAQAEHLYGEVARSLLVSGQFILAEQYVQAQRVAHTYCDAVNALFCEVDAIVTPGTPIAAPAMGVTTVQSESEEIPIGTALTRFTSLFNMTGHPAVVVPTGLNQDELPMAVQIVGRLFDEECVLSLAHHLEQKLGILRCPPAIGSHQKLDRP